MPEFKYKVKTIEEPTTNEYEAKWLTRGVTLWKEGGAIEVETSTWVDADPKNVRATFRHEVGHSQQMSAGLVFNGEDRFWVEVDAWSRTRSYPMSLIDGEHVLDALNSYRRALNVSDDEWLRARTLVESWNESPADLNEYEPIELPPDTEPPCRDSGAGQPANEGGDEGDADGKTDGEGTESGEGSDDDEANEGPGEGEDDDDSGSKEGDEGEGSGTDGKKPSESKPTKARAAKADNNADRDVWLHTVEGMNAAQKGVGTLAMMLGKKGWSTDDLPAITQVLMKGV